MFTNSKNDCEILEISLVQKFQKNLINSANVKKFKTTMKLNFCFNILKMFTNFKKILKLIKYSRILKMFT